MKMKNKMKSELETKTEICPLLSNQCRRRVIVRLNEERCMDGSYKSCLTYKVGSSNKAIRESGYAGAGRFKK
ncbi:Uncharacterised protein [uncultured archaeon]|nr:Uncharacterised protein [uncultured archaeon]